MSQTKDVQVHSKVRDGAKVNVWDTPGLYDSSHVKQETILTQLSELTKQKADLILMCFACLRGVRVDDSQREVINLLTKVYGKIFWKRSIFVMTFVNILEGKDHAKHHTMLKNIECDLKKSISRALQDIKCSKEEADKTAANVPFLTAGNEPKKLLDENEEWNRRLFLHCLESIDAEVLPTLVQARYGSAVWSDVLHTLISGVAGAAGGGVVAGGIGAGVGALVGVFAGPVGVGAGAAVGSIIGVTIGGILGAGVGVAVGASTISAKEIEILREKEKLIT